MFSWITLGAFYVVLVFVGPWFTIMALNTLFDLGIELTLGTWLAVAWIHIVLSNKTRTSKKEEE